MYEPKTMNELQSFQALSCYWLVPTKHQEGLEWALFNQRDHTLAKTTGSFHNRWQPMCALSAYTLNPHSNVWHEL
jgi:hypothetical protein